jgi:hypothetical protein
MYITGNTISSIAGVSPRLFLKKRVVLYLLVVYFLYHHINRKKPKKKINASFPIIDPPPALITPGCLTDRLIQAAREIYTSHAAGQTVPEFDEAAATKTASLKKVTAKDHKKYPSSVGKNYQCSISNFLYGKVKDFDANTGKNQLAAEILSKLPNEVAEGAAADEKTGTLYLYIDIAATFEKVTEPSDKARSLQKTFTDPGYCCHLRVGLAVRDVAAVLAVVVDKRHDFSTGSCYRK